jgi:phage-related protein
MNNTMSQKSKLKNDILNIKNKKDIVVRSIINRNNNSNFNDSTTFSNGNNKLKKSNALGNGLAVEHKKNKSQNNLSLSNSRQKLNKNEATYPKSIKIEKIKNNSIKLKTKKKEWDSPYKPIKNVYK